MEKKHGLRLWVPRQNVCLQLLGPTFIGLRRTLESQFDCRHQRSGWGCFWYGWSYTSSRNNCRPCTRNSTFVAGLVIDFPNKINGLAVCGIGQAHMRYGILLAQLQTLVGGHIWYAATTFIWNRLLGNAPIFMFQESSKLIFVLEMPFHNWSWTEG